MDPPVSSFWAKLRPYRGDAIEAWHPLPAHAADVAACLEMLLCRTLLSRRLARLGGQKHLTGVQIDRLCVLAALHDLGKCNVGFQNRKLNRPPFTAGHVEEALAAFGSEAGVRIGEALQFRTMMGWGEEETTFEDLLVTALGHHGRPVPPGQGLMRRVWEPTRKLNPFAGLRDLRDAVEDWYPDAFGSGGEPLPGSTRFQHGFNGVLTLADWLGSNEAFFPYAEEADLRRIDFARSRAREALEHTGLDAARARSGLIGRPPAFTDLWQEFEPRPAQRLLGELSVDGGSSLTILEAPTGSGKTEAALMRFFRLFAAGEVDGLYFALPTRAAASQMYGRVRETVRTAIPDPETRPPVIRAVPGYLSNGESRGSLLEERGALWDEDDRRWRYRSWASERPKRYLAGAVAVGTVDQVLLSALAVDHSHLRAASLLRHLLVVDEVHASDAYMSRLLEAVVERHLEAGGHAMLMSATLGERARHRYLELAAGQNGSPAELVEAREFPYPVVVHTSERESPEPEPVGAVDLSRKEVEVELAPSMEAPAAVARRVLSAADAGARVLVIRNTVTGCRRLQGALEDRAGVEDDRLFRCGSTPAPHHSRFATPDREALDAAVEEAFGKDRPAEGVILSATQTVEQSLDIDADLLVTDLCPADVLLQRVGRLHRHERSRPDGFDQPRVVVLVPDSSDLGDHILTRGEHAGRASGPHGIGTVYEDLRVLAGTWSALRDRHRIRLPSESRSLVEAATHPEALEDIVRARGEPWGEHARAMEGVRRAEAGLANLNLADWSVRFGDPGSLFPDRPGERVRTRLGEGDRRAVLSEEVAGPFGRPVREITVPAWMAPDAVEEEGADVVRSDAGETEFRFGSETYRYDRLGLRRRESSS